MAADVVTLATDSTSFIIAGGVTPCATEAGKRVAAAEASLPSNERREVVFV